MHSTSNRETVSELLAGAIARGPGGVSKQANHVLHHIAEDASISEDECIESMILFSASYAGSIASNPLPFTGDSVLTSLHLSLVKDIAATMEVPIDDKEAKAILDNVPLLCRPGSRQLLLDFTKLFAPLGFGGYVAAPIAYRTTVVIGRSAKEILSLSREVGRKLSNGDIKQIGEAESKRADTDSRGISIQQMQKQLEDYHEMLKQANVELIDNKQTIQKLNNRVLKNEEIRYSLIEAFTNAESEIDIMCPWVSQRVVDELHPLIEAALKRGVRIKILYGIADPGDKGGNRAATTDEAVNNMLRQFSKYDSAIELKNSADSINQAGTHGKLLICDDHYYVQGSYNWLSFGGDYRTRAREEIAEYSENPNLLAEYRKIYFQF